MEIHRIFLHAFIWAHNKI